MTTTPSPATPVATVRRVRRRWICPRVEVEVANRSPARWLLHGWGGLRMALPGGSIIAPVQYALEESSPVAVLEPGQRNRTTVDLWRRDQVERWPWRWLTGGAMEAWDLPRGWHRAEVWWEYSGDFGTEAVREMFESWAESAGAELWWGPIVSNRVRVWL